MNKVLIIDASPTDGRIPGAVIITAMRLPDRTARELINWLKTEGFVNNQRSFLP